MVILPHTAFAFRALVLLSALASQRCRADDESCSALGDGSCNAGGSLSDLASAAVAAVGCARPAGGHEDGSVAGGYEDLASQLECLFAHLYSAGSGFGGNDDMDEETRKALAYGELRPGAFAGLASGAGLFDVAMGPGDVFTDLGSGTGKLPLQAFLWRAKLSSGVELAQHRHDLAVQALQLLAPLVPGSSVESVGEDGSKAVMSLDDRRLTFQAGSLLELPLGDMTVVYAASLCFPEELMHLLAAKLRGELPVGSVFWTLKELPKGAHPGLALAGHAPGASTWDPRAKVLVYVRVPDLALPPVPPPSAVEDRVEARSMEKKILSAWGLEFVNVVRSEFDRVLKGVATDGAAVGDILRSDYFSEAATLLGASSANSGIRLLRAFAARGARTAQDRCGCGNIGGEPDEWSMSLMDFLGMLGHGAFPQANSSAGTTCLSSTSSCTLADTFVERVYFELRARGMCKGPSPPRSCGQPAAKGTLARDPELLKGHVCARLSDGRTLFQIAVTSKVQEVASFVLAKAGPGALTCTEYSGHNTQHVAAMNGDADVLEWLFAQVSKAPAPIARSALAFGDLYGRVPADMATKPEIAALVAAAASA